LTPLNGCLKDFDRQDIHVAFQLVHGEIRDTNILIDKKSLSNHLIRWIEYIVGKKSRLLPTEFNELDKSCSLSIFSDELEPRYI